jgi:pimeloyl-ACP methyl ester carboxylesterase
MPLNLAVLAPESADEVIDHFNAIERWAIGGHSLGGAMAARYVDSNPDAVKGLVLWASYPAPYDDLSDRSIRVTVIYGTEDGIATPSEILEAAERLPASAHIESIEGGNHAQFGWYGAQSGDGQANISHEAQQQRIIEATSQLLREITGDQDSRLLKDSKLAMLLAEPFVKMSQSLETRYVR